MFKSSVTVEEVVEFLNQMLALDPDCVLNLIKARVLCNDVIADHPTIQVNGDAVTGITTVGILGVLNGIFGTHEDGFGPITAVFDDDAGLVRFKLTQD